MIPVLQTERLTLRGPQRGDFASHAAFRASSRSVHEGGPRDARAAWEDFASSFGLWAIEGIPGSAPVDAGDVVPRIGRPS